MGTKDIMTMQEVQEMKQQLEQVFSIVRLLDGEILETGEGIEPPCQCYSIWGKDERCTNCISRKALKEKRQKTKIEIVDSKVYQVISKYLNIDGKPYIMEMINNLEDDDIIDSEDRENLLAELSGYADELYKDALTGVFNRRYYEDKVRNLESSAGVAMVDLDDFKLYNDTYGHDAGDKALKVVVEVIRRHVRKTDKVVRFGGDEFLLLIPDINVDNFTKKLKEIQEEVHAARVPGYSQLKLSVSIGGVLSTGEKLGEAVLRADKFMYRAKQRRLLVLVTDQIYEKEKNNRMMISILSQIVEFRNGESGAHVLHINIITELILERLIQKTDKYDLSSSVRRMIVTASALHDIGKIGIDDKILNKPGKLTKEEFEVIKTHSAIGASMLENLEYYKNEPLVRIAHDICRWHHERYDGKGYPDGLKGEEIPISAQVVALADVYDALISDRVYKKAYSHEKAVEMILNGECGTFNPLLLECLKDIQGRLKEEMTTMSEERAETEDSGSATSEFEGYEKTKEELFKSMSEDIRKEYIDTIPTIGGGENRRS